MSECLSDDDEVRIAAQERDTEQRRAFVAGLREMADFIDAHPNLPTPYGSAQNTFVNTKEALAVIAREPGVRWEKSASDGYFYLKVSFAGGHAYEVNLERAQVCRKVVTGTRIEPARPEQEVETYIWECDEPLLAVQG
jgi:hypothetical protein